MIAISRENVTFAALEQEFGNSDSFWEGGKPGVPKENPCDLHQQLNPHTDTGLEWSQDQITERRAMSRLRHSWPGLSKRWIAPSTG